MSHTRPLDLVSFMKEMLGDQMRLAAGLPLKPHNEITREAAGQIIEETESDRTKILDAHYQTIQTCRVEGCENEARWPFNTCDECTAETAVGA